MSEMEETLGPNARDGRNPTGEGNPYSSLIWKLILTRRVNGQGSHRTLDRPASGAGTRCILLGKHYLLKNFRQIPTFVIEFLDTDT